MQAVVVGPGLWDHWPIPHTQVGFNAERALTVGDEDLHYSRATVFGRYVFQYGDSLYLPPMQHVDLLDLATRKVNRIVWATEDLKDPRLSPDGRWISFVAAVGTHRWQAFVAPVSQVPAAPQGPPPAVTQASNLDSR